MVMPPDGIAQEREAAGLINNKNHQRDFAGLNAFIDKNTKILQAVSMYPIEPTPKRSQGQKGTSVNGH